MDIEILKPNKKPKIIDLVKAAGIDVRDWANCKGGKQSAARNPKYCFEWSFSDDKKKIAVINLWFKDLKSSDGQVYQQLNLKKVAEKSSNPLRKRRAIDTDALLKTAFTQSWTLRVVILDGKNMYSETDRRNLDAAPWHIKDYNSLTSECYIFRGLEPSLPG